MVLKSVLAGKKFDAPYVDIHFREDQTNESAALTIAS